MLHRLPLYLVLQPLNLQLRLLVLHFILQSLLPAIQSLTASELATQILNRHLLLLYFCPNFIVLCIDIVCILLQIVLPPILGFLRILYFPFTHQLLQKRFKFADHLLLLFYCFFVHCGFLRFLCQYLQFLGLIFVRHLQTFEFSKDLLGGGQINIL